MLLCVRTTIDLPDELFRALKKRAADEGVTLRDLFARACRRYLREPSSKQVTGYRLKWKVTGRATDAPIDWRHVKTKLAEEETGRALSRYRIEPVAAQRVADTDK